jgi:hypothetical protein
LDGSDDYVLWKSRFSREVIRMGDKCGKPAKPEPKKGGCGCPGKK